MVDGQPARARAVTFDYGQTLAELDHEFMAERVRALGGELDAASARAAHVAAWEAYGVAKTLGHARAWQRMMIEFLKAGSVRPRAGQNQADYPEQIAQRLWEAQPTANLWRKRIPGMFELVRELAAHHIPVAVISNSEGRLAELLTELGEAAPFHVVVDSGRLGIDKPDPRIFQHTADALSVPLTEIIHVGDAWEADVMGARNVGARAVWFAPLDERPLPDGVVACRDASELRQALVQSVGPALG